jgi:hypothetical protein
MIQHVRVRRVAIPSDILEKILQQREETLERFSHAHHAEESLDVLLKHAFKAAPAEEEEDNSHVWQKLARKMMGPFGAPALEGPTQSSLEVELTNSGGWSRPVPFALSTPYHRDNYNDVPGHASLWSFLRFDCVGLPQPGSNSLLA